MTTRGRNHLILFHGVEIVSPFVNSSSNTSGPLVREVNRPIHGLIFIQVMRKRIPRQGTNNRLRVVVNPNRSKSSDVNYQGLRPSLQDVVSGYQGSYLNRVYDRLVSLRVDNSSNVTEVMIVVPIMNRSCAIHTSYTTRAICPSPTSLTTLVLGTRHPKTFYSGKGRGKTL